MSRSSQRGVALVITLIMLAVVTVMAVLFLGLSRRERVSVIVTADLTGAKNAAEISTARAQAEMIGRIAASSNLFAYGMMVSTNYTQRAFVPGVSAYTNVGYNYANGLPLNNDADIRQNLTNLFYDPRPPVYVVTNENTAESEFRFYLDLNRNGLFDTNGWQTVFVRPQLATNLFLWGDPEWIGILEHPDQPHSASNRFVARYAYLVLPIGKTLDLNFMHNWVRRPDGNLQPLPTPLRDGFLRNQGAGSWEINLAAFFRDLNTNIWPPTPLCYTYDPAGLNNSGWAFEDAVNTLRYRYRNNFNSLRSVDALFAGTPAPVIFRTDGIDIYSDGQLMTGVKPANPEGSGGNFDDTAQPWSGSDNTNGYYSVFELFDPAKSSVNFTNRLLPALRTGNSYMRDTFSRLMAQLGTDSLPANRGKLNLLYDNVDANGLVNPQLTTNFITWTPIRFFTNAADLMLRRQYGGLVTATSIPIWPTNMYGGGVHRLLQLAANLHDDPLYRVLAAGTTNHYLPTVFRPLFRRTGTNIFISGFAEVTNSLPLSAAWVDLRTISTNQISTTGDTHVNVYGVPWVISARKGFPNFNEFLLKTTVQVTRRLEAVKDSPTDTTPVFNQLYEIGISNLFGLESWNSYTQAYPGQLNLRLTNSCALALTDETRAPANIRNSNYFARFEANVPPNTWVGEQFRVPLSNQFNFIPDMAYYPLQNPPLQPSAPEESVRFDRVPGFPVPSWKLYATNRLTYAVIDTTTDRIVDFVNLDHMLVTMDINRALVGSTNIGFSSEIGTSSRVGAFWQTNRVGSGSVDPRLAPVNSTIGITNQIFYSFTNILSDAEWASYSQDPMAGDQKLKAIDEFRRFLGFSGLPGYTNPPTPGKLRMQVPFTPTRKLDLKMSWSANDPLVHYHIDDLYHPDYANTNNIIPFPANVPPPPSNLGQLNERYNPWGGRPGASTQGNQWAFDPTVKDTLVRFSDDWDFPTNRFPNIGWLGRVHRGTPWQTIYLKSILSRQDINNALQSADAAASVGNLMNNSMNSWIAWGGRPDTHPITDWPLLQLFTVAPNDNAARGLLSVNQTNLAAWSAVLSAVPVLTNTVGGVTKNAVATNWGNLWIEPGSPQLRAIVDSINATRLTQPGQAFNSLGAVLASPGLTIESPFLNPTNDVNQMNFGISDAVYERIPQQILSLLKEDEPVVAIYAYGQSLKPAERSVVTAPGTYYNLCTNYQITGEVVTKSIVRFLELPKQNQTDPAVYKAVVESFNILSAD